MVSVADRNCDGKLGLDEFELVRQKSEVLSEPLDCPGPPLLSLLYEALVDNP